MCKDGISGFWGKVYSTLIHHILPEKDRTLEIDNKTRAMLELLEERSKTMLLRYNQTYPGQAEQDPFYYYLNGKLDGKFMTEVLSSFLQRVVLYKLIFPTYPIRWTTHEIDGRTAVRRIIFNMLERRGIVNHCLSQLYANKRQWSSVFGGTVMPMCIQCDETKNKKLKSSPELSQSSTDNQDSIMRKKVLRIIYEARSMDDTITPHTAKQALNNKLKVSSKVWTIKFFHGIHKK